MSFLLGIDSGTSVVKSVVFDLNGLEVASTRREMPVVNDGVRSEVDMAEAWAVTAETVREAVRQVDAASIEAVGISGTACGYWGVDNAGQPLRRAILWNDGRAASTLAGWQGDGFFGHVFAISGTAPSPGYPLALLRWLHDHEPDTIERTRWLLFHKDWLRCHLTGEFSTDEADAAYFPGDLRARTYSQTLLERAGIAGLAPCLPPVYPSSHIAGTVTAQAAAETGLQEGTPVATGAVDVVSSLLGGGAHRHGQACSVLGTSLLNTLVLDAPSFDPPDTGVQACMPDGLWARSLVNTSGTLSINWMLDVLAADERHEAASTGADVYALLERTAQESPPGAHGLVFLPYLNTSGIISPFANADARGQFFGLSIEHKRSDLMRAVYEGVALAMRDCYQAMNQQVDEVILVGGGARSAFWAQMFADAAGKRIIVPSGAEFGARGAAILAGTGAGVFTGLGEAIAQMVQPDAVYEPGPAAPIYDTLYELYHTLYSSAPPLWAQWRTVYDRLKQAQ